MKIYTRTGDQGKSSLFSGERVLKNHPRMKAYGDVDELNSMIGALVVALPMGAAAAKGQLEQIQGDLFRVGAVLATTSAAARAKQITPIVPADIQRLEGFIDQLQTGLPELKHFILPGGHPAAALAHVARTVCRRAERGVVDLMQEGDPAASGDPSWLADALIYLNRLSDFLFVVARHCNAVAGMADVMWQG
jgi:cob(I)alamin adenosyltransferase